MEYFRASDTCLSIFACKKLCPRANKKSFWLPFVPHNLCLTTEFFDQHYTIAEQAARNGALVLKEKCFWFPFVPHFFGPSTLTSSSFAAP